jgi:hypothetical protein
MGRRRYLLLFAPHSFETVVDLQVSEKHLNTFAFVT